MFVRLTKLAIPVLAAVTLAGCSTIKFAYNNVDWMLLNKADHYLDLTDSQRQNPVTATSFSRACTSAWWTMQAA